MLLIKNCGFVSLKDLCHQLLHLLHFLLRLLRFVLCLFCSLQFPKFTRRSFPFSFLHVVEYGVARGGERKEEREEETLWSPV